MNIIDYSKEQNLLKQEPGRKWWMLTILKEFSVGKLMLYRCDLWVCRCISV
jgi:hypothetical protein